MIRKMPSPLYSFAATTKRVIITLTFVLILSFGFFGLLDHVQASQNTIRGIQSRADRIFKIDREEASLPRNRVAALSVALAFHDYTGAEKLIRELERAHSRK